MLNINDAQKLKQIFQNISGHMNETANKMLVECFYSYVYDDHIWKLYSMEGLQRRPFLCILFRYYLLVVDSFSKPPVQILWLLPTRYHWIVYGGFQLGIIDSRMRRSITIFAQCCSSNFVPDTGLCNGALHFACWNFYIGMSIFEPNIQTSYGT